MVRPNYKTEPLLYGHAGIMAMLLWSKIMSDADPVRGGRVRQRHRRPRKRNASSSVNLIDGEEHDGDSSSVMTESDLQSEASEPMHDFLQQLQLERATPPPQQQRQGLPLFRASSPFDDDVLTRRSRLNNPPEKPSEAVARREAAVIASPRPPVPQAATVSTRTNACTWAERIVEHLSLAIDLLEYDAKAEPYVHHLVQVRVRIERRRLHMSQPLIAPCISAPSLQFYTRNAASHEARVLLARFVEANPDFAQGLSMQLDLLRTWFPTSYYECTCPHSLSLWSPARRHVLMTR